MEETPNTFLRDFSQRKELSDLKKILFDGLWCFDSFMISTVCSGITVGALGYATQ